MKRVLIVPGSLRIGGAEKVARDIAVLADPHKYEFHYVVFGDVVGEYEADVIKCGSKVIHWDEPLHSYRQFFRNLGRQFRNVHYDVVHVHTMFNAGWFMLAAKLNCVPIRITHSHSILAGKKNVVERFYEYLMSFLIHTCSTDWLACGREAGERLFGRDFFKRHGNTILNGIDIRNFSFCPEKRAEIRGQLGAENRFIIGHVGHLAAVKNQSFLLDCMPFVLSKRPDSYLLLLGEGPDRSMLERKIAELHLEDYVVLTGNVDNVCDYLCAMDVFAFPSLYEGMPLSLLEAQANGLPCVISNCVPDDVFITDLIHPLALDMDKEKWAEALCNAKRTNTLAYQKIMIQSKFDVSNVMSQIYKVYDR